MIVTIVLDWRDINSDGFVSLNVALKKLGIYLYDLDQAIHKQVRTDSWILTLSDHSLSKKKLKEEWRETFK